MGLVLLVAAAGCGGGGSRSPESVVRGWSAAIDRGDDKGAAETFARDAVVVQGTLQLRLHTRADAVTWNSGLPCAGKIVDLTVNGAEVRVTFVLGDRPGHRCDGPGHRAAAIFRVRNGKIVLWHQVGTGAPSGAQPEV